eukprot:gene6273-biopygen7838
MTRVCIWTASLVVVGVVVGVVVVTGGASLVVVVVVVVGGVVVVVTGAASLVVGAAVVVVVVVVTGAASLVVGAVVVVTGAASLVWKVFLFANVDETVVGKKTLFDTTMGMFNHTAILDSFRKSSGAVPSLDVCYARFCTMLRKVPAFPVTTLYPVHH